MILVTGGLGYIGSHTTIELLNKGENVLILDNLSNSSVNTLDRIDLVCGRKPYFIYGDIKNYELLLSIFSSNKINSVIHLAGVKSVSESVENPAKYYDTNLLATINLFSALAKFNIKNVVFSSSAAVYSENSASPIHEDTSLNPSSPYGRSKFFAEQFLQDISNADPSWHIVALRYFNVVGAHGSGLIGESLSNPSANLASSILKSLNTENNELHIFGHDYPTPDGTGIRDYIHVNDIATGHLAALKMINKSPGFHKINLGTGIGYSVIDFIKAFEKTIGRRVPFILANRRVGDVAVSFADPSLASSLMEWRAVHTLEDMCRDSWRWEGTARRNKSANN